MTSFKIKLRGMNWTVKLVTEKELADAHKEGKELMGLTVFEHLTIYVRNDMHPDQTRSTFYHELCHAILAPTNGANTDIQTQSADIETVCNLIGDAMCELTKQMKNWPASILPKWMLNIKAKKVAS